MPRPDVRPPDTPPRTPPRTSIISPSYSPLPSLSPSSCSCHLSQAYPKKQAQARAQVEARLAFLARTLLSRSTSRRRPPRCLCPMLDACDDPTPIARTPYSRIDVDTNHWADADSPVVTRAPRASLEGSPISSAAGSGRNSPSGSGLRSRRAALQSQSGLGLGHRRSSTADDSVLTAAAHPLQPSSPSRMGLSRSAEEGVTRPALRRLLSDKGLWPERSSTTEEQEGQEEEVRAQVGEAEMLVVVHEVSRTDSLAGVALKYGISLADLRKVNQLWASDSIHLRKTLHIPVHLTDGKRFPLDHPDSVTNGTGASDPFVSNGKPSVPMKRVPISQLKFFPPSSQPPQLFSDSSIMSSASGPNQSYSSSTSAQTLTSFLHALPLPSRHNIFTRMSIDSSESSSVTGASETSSDQEHELDVLGRGSSPDDGRTPNPQQRTFASSPSPYRKRATLGRAALISKRDSESDATILMSDFDVDFREAVPLQTEQLKPSPRMVLPKVQRDL